MTFRLQVIGPNGELAATWRPGDRAELDLIQRVADRVATKPVGLFRTKARVRQEVVTALEEVIHELKARVKPT